MCFAIGNVMLFLSMLCLCDINNSMLLQSLFCIMYSVLLLIYILNIIIMMFSL